jgi:integrase/recombinase XerD
MSQTSFRCVLAQSMKDFVAFKISQGYNYSNGAIELCYFDRFLLRAGYDHHVITAAILENYIASMRQLSKNTQYSRLAVVRVFARWLRSLIGESAIIEEIPVKRPSLPRHYLYSHAEITALIQAARQLGRKRGNIRASCHATLIGLLCVTGLRIGEALSLNLNDIDLAQSRLTVRRGKLGKARNIVLSSSTTAALGRYLHSRLTFPPNRGNAPVFINTRGGRLRYSVASQKFRELLRLCGIGAGASQAPRLHDLRHTFACNCLRKWYEDSADVNAKLPILATAMGHTNINNTQIYLHVTAQLLHLAAGRFHKTFTNNCTGAHL